MKLEKKLPSWVAKSVSVVMRARPTTVMRMAYSTAVTPRSSRRTGSVRRFCRNAKALSMWCSLGGLEVDHTSLLSQTALAVQQGKHNGRTRSRSALGRAVGQSRRADGRSADRLVAVAG